MVRQRLRQRGEKEERRAGSSHPMGEICSEESGGLFHQGDQSRRMEIMRKRLKGKSGEERDEETGSSISL